MSCHYFFLFLYLFFLKLLFIKSFFLILKTKRRSQHKKLVKDFQQQANNFESVARDFTQREDQFRRRLSEESLDRQDRPTCFSGFDAEWGVGNNSLHNNLGAGTGMEEEEEEPMTEEEKHLHQQLVQQELDVNEVLIQERKEEMQNVHSKIVQVNDIFQDLAGMIEDQGDQVEQIRGDLQFASKKTEAGVKELDKANDYQKSSTKKLACCGIFIFVAVVVVVLVTLIEKK